MDQQQENMWVKSGQQLEAARQMLVALKYAVRLLEADHAGSTANARIILRLAITAAKDAGITTGEDT